MLGIKRFNAKKFHPQPKISESTLIALPNRNTKKTQKLKFSYWITSEQRAILSVNHKFTSKTGPFQSPITIRHLKRHIIHPSRSIEYKKSDHHNLRPGKYKPIYQSDMTRMKKFKLLRFGELSIFRLVADGDGSRLAFAASLGIAESLVNYKGT